MNKTKRKSYWAWSLPALLLASAATLLAQEGGIVFEPPEDVILGWAKRACLVVTIASVALILLILVWRRNRLMEASSKWLLFLGLCVLPVPVALLSSGIGMEESKAVEFCHACHAPMDPFVDDMMDRESETLAALHYKKRYIQHEQCWTCHSDYGIAGTGEAKMTGLIHITKYTTGDWEAPIHLYHPYKWTICLECHAASTIFQEEESHEEVVEDIMSGGETKCTDCHGLAHPEPEERS